MTLIWSLKSSNNEAKVDISNQEKIASHITIKELREGTYEFELKLINQQGTTVSSDIVKIEVLASKKTLENFYSITMFRKHVIFSFILHNYFAICA